MPLFLKKKMEINNSRIYTKKDLDKMDLPFIEEGIFLNKTKLKEDFSPIDSDIRKNMVVINYVDCSSESFSNEKLTEVVDKQIKNNDSHFIVLPYFRGESDHDIRVKSVMAENLKMNTEKKIILEMSYKSTISPEELNDLSINFDYLSIFYGTHYGHYPSFEKIVWRIVSFKMMTRKKVFCFAIPLKFSGGVLEDVRFMPCFGLICDGWIKNWRKGGGGKNVIKVTDPLDFKYKNYESWLSTGYLPNSILTPINRSVFELFSKDSQEVRKEYDSFVLDEALADVNNLNPLNILDYVSDKFHDKYFKLIIVGYKEKIIEEFREISEFNNYGEDGRKRIERKLRSIFSPAEIMTSIKSMVNLIKTESSPVPLNKLIEVIEKREIV